MSSPTRVVSPSSISSYDYFSAHSHAKDSSESDQSYGTLSDETSSNDDEIVLSFSEISFSSMSFSGILSQHPDIPRSPGAFSDDEFILMSRPRTPSRSAVISAGTRGSDTSTSEDELAASFAAFSLTIANTGASAGKKKRRTRKKRAAAAAASSSAVETKAVKPKKKAKSQVQASSPASVTPQTAQSKTARRKARKTAARATAPLCPARPGFGDRPVVDDVSKTGDYAGVTCTTMRTSTYLRTFPISLSHLVPHSLPLSFLSDPASKSGTSNLTLLQALIIELGLCPSALSPSAASFSFHNLPSLPHSLRAAKALLKSARIPECV
ncbi:hypothetical protein A0H81_04500 [Grifola frondosa]|uniref:Uncharacterized protein n=1 Tax=Grifola frondosa TaxID=5627 RepID=A0A1C7MF02_GRIFR|nr:hypothetical protein A0H81_04500 [Grifola frondosa]